MCAKWKWNPDAPSRRLRRAARQSYDWPVVRNSYHGTSYRLRARYYQPLGPHAIKVCRQTLCPEPGCRLCGKLGEFGEQDVVIKYGCSIEGKLILTIQPLDDKHV